VPVAAAHRQLVRVRFREFLPPPGTPNSRTARRAPTRLASSCRQITDLRPRFGLGIQLPWPAKTAPLRATLGHSEIPENQFSQFPGGATAERIPGFGSGSVREMLGYGFGNRLIVFDF
jgi:hypothetical protein